MPRSKYLKVTEKVETLDYYSFLGDLEKTIKVLNGLYIKYSKYDTLHIEVDHGYDGDQIEFTVYGTRGETDEERTERLEVDRKEREYTKNVIKMKEDMEREEYERLKKKYDN